MATNNYPRPTVQVTTDTTRPISVTGSEVSISNLAEIATEANPLPVSVEAEVLETLSALRVATELLAAQSSRFMPDTSGRNRVAIESGGVTISSGTLTTVTTVTTVTTTGTLTNQTNIGGLAANPQIPSLMMMTADNLRRNITVS